MPKAQDKALKSVIMGTRLPRDIADGVWSECPAVRRAVRLANTDGGKASLREKQRALREWLLGVVTTAEGRERYVEWALENPGEAMRHAIASMPREEMREETHSVRVVFVPGKQTAEEWLAENTEGGMEEPDWLRDVPVIEGEVL